MECTFPWEQMIREAGAVLGLAIIVIGIALSRRD